MPEPERSLIWEHTPAEDRFGCSVCSWTFPNPQGAAEGEQDMLVVDLRFQRHSCDANSNRDVAPLTATGHIHELPRKAIDIGTRRTVLK
jgi:hypothetical protein